MKEIKRDRHLKQLIDSQPNGFITVILNSFRHIDNADNHIMPRRNEEGILVHQEFGVMGLYVQSLFTVNAFFPPFRLRVFFSSYSLQI